MAEVLSQSQIDALLNSMQSGGGAEEKKEEKPEIKYKKYDFYSPKKYTKDRLKMLRTIYDNYARIASSQINGLFKVASEVGHRRGGTEILRVRQRFKRYGRADHCQGKAPGRGAEGSHAFTYYTDDYDFHD